MEDDRIRVKTWYPIVVDLKKRLMKTIKNHGIELTPSTKNNSKNLLVLKNENFQLATGRMEVMNALVGKMKFQYVPTKKIVLKA